MDDPRCNQEWGVQICSCGAPGYKPWNSVCAGIDLRRSTVLGGSDTVCPTIVRPSEAAKLDYLSILRGKYLKRQTVAIEKYFFQYSLKKTKTTNVEKVKYTLASDMASDMASAAL